MGNGLLVLLLVGAGALLAKRNAEASISWETSPDQYPIDYETEFPVYEGTPEQQPPITSIPWSWPWESTLPQPEPEIIPATFTTETAIMNQNWKVNEYPTYAAFIEQTERKYNIPRDLLARLLYQESRFRQDVITGQNRSTAGAVGIAQFMPATAAEMHIDRYDPWQSIDGAGAYLKRQYDRFHNWQHALMAYNWGPGNMSSYLRTGKGANGQPLPLETANYHSQILADVRIPGSVIV